MHVSNLSNYARLRSERDISTGQIFAARGDISAMAGAHVESAGVRERRLSHQAHARIARALAPVLVALVFWLHTVAPAGVAVSALYVAPILLFIRTGRFWEPVLVAVAAANWAV